jgi:acetyl esterase/lipase
MLATAVRRTATSALFRLGILGAFLLAMTPVPAQALAPGGVVVTPNVAYGADQGEQLRLDVYQPPAATSPSPIVMLIHGGGWVSGDKQDAAPFARSLAAAGFVVFSINYSLDLSTSPAYPREVTDVGTALTWVRQHATDFQGDPERIGVAGGSAGAYLAAMLGTKANSSKNAPVRAVVSLSGPMDVGALVTAVRQAVTPSGVCAPADCAAVQKATEGLRALLGCAPLQCPAGLVAAASPVTHVTADSPSFFLANSTDETVPAAQATLMAAALRSRHVQVKLELVPGNKHGIAYVQTIRDPLLTFLETHVAGKAAATAVPLTGQPARPGGNRAAKLRWLLVVAILGATAAAVVVLGRRSSARHRDHHGDPLEHPSPSDDRR